MTTQIAVTPRPAATTLILRQGAAGLEVLLAHAAAQAHLPPLHPRLQRDAQGRISAVLLPGQAGYDAAGPPA